MSQELITQKQPSQPNLTTLPTQGISSAPISFAEMLYEDEGIMCYEPDWFNTAWDKRISLTVETGQIPSTQSNFPTLIDRTITELIGAVEAELRFTSSDNIQLDYEIINFDSPSGKLIAWVRMPSISDSDLIYIYYDNPAAVDEQNPSSVWSSEYKLVHHLEPDISDNIPDSTINNNKSTATTSTPNYEDAKIAKGFRSDVTEMFSAPNSPSLDIGIGSFTIEIIVETFAASDTFYGLIEKKVSANGFNPGFLLWLDFRSPDRGMSFRLNDGTHDIDIINNYDDDARALLKNNGLHHIAVTYDSITKQLCFYIDGILGLVGSYTSSGFFSNSEPLRILGQANLDALVDEVRLSNVVKSQDYITTVQNNQMNHTTFFSVGTEETLSSVPIIPMGYEA